MGRTPHTINSWLVAGGKINGDVDNKAKGKIILPRNFVVHGMARIGSFTILCGALMIGNVERSWWQIAGITDCKLFNGKSCSFGVKSENLRLIF